MRIEFTSAERFWFFLFLGWAAFATGALGEDFRDYKESTNDGMLIAICVTGVLLLFNLSQERAFKREVKRLDELSERADTAVEGISDELYVARMKVFQRYQNTAFSAFFLGLFLFLWPFKFEILPLSAMMQYYWVWLSIFAAGSIVLLLLRVRESRGVS